MSNAVNKLNAVKRMQQRGAPELPGKPTNPVGLPQNYWGDRQKDAIAEFVSLAPIIALVAGLPEIPELPEDGDVEALLGSRMDRLMQARKVVIDRLRKGI